MHSIFTLRLFNDCFAVFFFFLAIYCYQKRWWIAGSVIYSIGLGVKMSLLLALPSVGIVLLQAIGASDAIGHASLIVLIQVMFLILASAWLLVLTTKTGPAFIAVHTA
jgi:alpha-1,3-mannosyltransferase